MVSTRSSSANRAPTSTSTSISTTTPPNDLRSRTGGRSSPSSPSSPPSPRPFTHTPTPLSLLWLAVSLPLVTWDTIYVLGRPHTMPGGSLHWPLWVPYELYGRVDHVYGFKAWDAGLGFTGAQGLMNAVETVLYAVYFGLWFWGREKRQGEGRVKGVEGRRAALAVVVGLAASVMTLSKTVLYWLCEYYSGFDNIGHNSLGSLFWLWIVPNGLWLIFPSYMIYALGSEIVDGLAGGRGVIAPTAPAVKAE